ncbi:MAG: dihydrolipoamide acyltransferase [Fusobacteriia bacterium 4572_74]|nr:MAG: dihydrolipoamide acyltransferase [Fusobacteriia bacterium 4572_74]
MLKKDLSYTLEKIISPSETAIKMESGGLDVFSTPNLIAFMEKTAFLSVEKYLDKENTTVGISINAKHLKANLVGDKLNCIATLNNIDGKKLSFEIVVIHEETIIGSCFHDRFIVNKEKFINKLIKR